MTKLSKGVAMQKFADWKTTYPLNAMRDLVALLGMERGGKPEGKPKKIAKEAMKLLPSMTEFIGGKAIHPPEFIRILFKGEVPETHTINRGTFTPYEYVLNQLAAKAGKPKSKAKKGKDYQFTHMETRVRAFLKLPPLPVEVKVTPVVEEAARAPLLPGSIMVPRSRALEISENLVRAFETLERLGERHKIEITITPL